MHQKKHRQLSLRYRLLLALGKDESMTIAAKTENPALAEFPKRQYVVSVQKKTRGKSAERR